MDTKFCERHRPLCRSEPARDGLKDTAGCQAASVIVNVHREPARSYRGFVVAYLLAESTRIIRSRS